MILYLQLVTPEVYDQHLARSIKEAENKIQNTFHCKTPNCQGWCIFEDNVNEFLCPVCDKMNCLTCQVGLKSIVIYYFLPRAWGAHVFHYHF